MRVALVLPFYDAGVRTASGALAAHPLVRMLPVELASLGHTVHVLHLAPFDNVMRLDGVIWTFVQPAAFTRIAGRLAFRWKRAYGPAYYQPSARLLLRLRAWRPDVVHVFGMTLDLQLALLARLCSGAGIPLVTHYHGGLPAPGRLGRVQRHNLSRVDRALFTVRSQAEPWIDAGMLRSWAQVEEVLETTSTFTGIDCAAARALTGMHGDPVYLSAGRLHPIKDPLTMLRGFARLAEEQPGARLYLHYLSAEMLPEVEALIAADARLRARVELRGRAPGSEMEAIYSSADFLLQASLREWSGLTVLEAMSCGCIPLVTRIPSFEAMTGLGRFGRLFAVGDPDGLAQAALSVRSPERSTLAHAVQQHFREQLSFAAIARQIDRVYRDIARFDAKND